MLVADYLSGLHHLSAGKHRIKDTNKLCTKVLTATINTILNV